MLLGLHHMHDKHILHRDLKSQNIFIKNGLLQLGDLGISKALTTGNDFASTCIGTPYYMSPELFKNRPYNHKSDVWALGCILYELCTMKHPFDAASLNGLALKIMKGGYHTVGGYSKGMGTLISTMLNVNPAIRPSVKELLLQPVIRRNVRRFVQVVCRHREFYKEVDVQNFVKQIQKLGYGEMIAEITGGGPGGSGPSPLKQVGAGEGAKDVKKALELVGLEEREKQRMEVKLQELKDLQAERERRLKEKDRQREAPSSPGRRGGGVVERRRWGGWV